MSAPKPARLVPVEHFADVAWLYGIRESAATLQLTGRLTRVAVGRRDFYLRDDIDRLRSTVTKAEVASAKALAIPVHELEDFLLDGLDADEVVRP